MNDQDLKTVVILVRGLRAAMGEVQHLLAFGGDPTRLAKQITSMLETLGRLTFELQQRRVVTWHQPQPRHNPAPRILPPLQSTDFPDEHVERFGLSGRSISEQPAPPPRLSGQWVMKPRKPRRRRK